MGYWFPKFSLSRPVTVFMGIIASLLIGWIAYQRLPLQLFPSGFTPPFVFVRIYYPNSTPKEVEEQITRPAESMLSTIRGIERMRSWSSGGSVGIFMRFRSRMSSSEIYNQVRDRMERLMPTLPEDTDRYYIWRWDPDSRPIFSFGISMKEKSKHVYSYFYDRLFQPLQGLPGVSRVGVSGTQKASVRIEVDRNLAKSHRISIYQLIRTLRGDNFSMPSGQMRHGKRVFYLRSQSRFKNLDDFRNYPVKNGIKLKEIAKVSYDVDPASYIFRINAKEGLSIYVYKASGVNTVELCEKIKKLIRRAFRSDPKMAKYGFHTYFNQGKEIKNSLEQLQTSAFWGGIFAFLILIVFLRHLRITLLVTLCIPLCIMVTLGYLYFTGETLNVITLMGLMLSVGMTVDNAIVVVENIARIRTEGGDLKKACLEGAGEVGLAILLATMTTIVVFLPLSLLGKGGMVQFYLSKIATPVIVSLVASLFVALLVIPVGAFLYMGEKKPAKWALFEKINSYYKRFLAFLLRHKLDFVVVSILILISTRYPMKKVKKSFMGRSKNAALTLRFTFAKNQEFSKKNQYLKQVENLLLKKKKLWGIKHFEMNLGRYQTTARCRVYLDAKKAEKGLTLDRNALRKKMRKLLPEVPGVIRRVGWRPLGGSQNSSITLRLFGPDTKTLEDLALKLEEHLHLYKEFQSVEADVNRDALPEIQFLLKKAWAIRYQLSARIIGGNISYALSGRRLRDMQIRGHQVSVRIGMKRKDRSSLHQLRQLPLTTFRRPDPIALKFVTKNKKAMSPRVIAHTNRKSYKKITINTNSKDLKGVYQKLDEVMQSFPLPQGYSWDKGWGFRDMQRSDSDQAFALILSITFVLLLIGILFESFFLPFSVILAIPLAFVGVYWVLYLTDTTLNIMANIGLIMLVGIVVNHAIVLVDRVNQLRDEGMERDDAILNAGAQRLRPILMTALTTVFGLLPMAVGKANIVGISYQPLGRTVIAGLLSSLLLSLIVVPLFYTFFDDLKEHFLSFVRYFHQQN